MKRPARSRRNERLRDPRMAVLRKSVEVGNFSVAEVLEILYLSSEKELLQIMRRIIRMNPRARAAHQIFFSLSTNPGLVTATIDGEGRLILESPEVKRDIAAFRSAVSVECGAPTSHYN